MPLNSTQRNRLLARSHSLKAGIHVGRGGVTEGVVELVRQALASNELVKVRLSADERDALDQFAEQIAERVPCELVKRVGFVAILYRGGDPAPDKRDAEFDDDDSIE